MKQVKISVIVPAYNARATITDCLGALEDQSLRDECEIIVVDSSTDDTAAVVAEMFPEVRLFTFPERRFPSSARNFAVSQARGEIIAFTDADCVVAPGWLGEIIGAHRSDLPVIGGAIDNGSPESYIGWVYYFCEFNQWMPRARRGLVGEIPTCCLSLKRAAFDRYGPFLDGTYCSDTAFHWNLRRDGYQPLFVPTMKVSHQYRGSLKSFLRHEWFHGKCFGRVRTSELGLTRRQRALFAARTLYLPLLQFYLTASRVARRSSYLREFVLSSPLVFLGILAWSYGELSGYLSHTERRA